MFFTDGHSPVKLKHGIDFCYIEENRSEISTCMLLLGTVARA